MRRMWDYSAGWVSLRACGFVFLAVAASGASGLSAAALAREQHRPARAISNDAEPRDKQPKIEAAPPGPLLLVVSVNAQHVSVYGGGGLITQSPVSTGRPDHPTPLGIFSILEKERYHFSNLYSGAPMPYMERITWSGVALHAGQLPGYAASHGCIRLPYDFSKRLYGFTKGGERVIVTRQDVSPLDFMSPKLPEPKLLPDPAAPAAVAVSTSQQVLQNAIAVSDPFNPRTAAISKLDISVRPDAQVPAAADVAPPKLLNPVEFARIMKARAAAESDALVSAVKAARDAVIVLSPEAAAAAAEARRTVAAYSNAKSRLGAAADRLREASGDEAVTEAKAAKAAAEDAAQDMEARASAAERLRDETALKLAAASKAFKDAEDARLSLADEAKSWQRRQFPVSIFISRRTGRLYVRQGRVKIFDMPVSIRDPETPVGTHLYLAMQPGTGAAEGNPKLRWLVLSLPGGYSSGGDDRRSKKRRWRDQDDGFEQEQEQALPSARDAGTEAAQTALERVEIPADVMDKLSEMIWTGASLMISDYPLSSETGEGTDFIVATR